MKIVYGVGTLAFVAALVAVWAAMNQQIALAPGITPVTAFMDAAVIPKLIMIVCLLITIVGTMTSLLAPILAIARQNQVARVLALCLGCIAIIVALLGFLGWAYGESIIREAMAATGTTSADVVAPSRVEAMLTLAMGLFPAAIFAGMALLTAVLADLFRPKAV